MSTCFGFVSTYPPTACGLATFTSALRRALLAPGDDEGLVVRLVDDPEARPSDEVVAQVVVGDPPSLDRALAQLNDCDVAVVQHEYGIYGGRDGDDVIALLDRLQVPSIVVLHTVLSDPTPHQHAVLQAVVDGADAVVTMTTTAHDRLVANYSLEAGKVSIIAHGAPEVAPDLTFPTFRTGRRTVLSWGLLGPGKGIEWGIGAMALLTDLDPMPSYVIAGRTHPKVLLREGEAYRQGLHDQATRLGIHSSVRFESSYLDDAALGRLVRSADVILLPYDSTDQVTSGVLIEAVAAGKPVVATEFPHARELLADGAGLVVPHRDPVAIAAALRTVLTRTDVATTMASNAAANAPKLRWPAIAEQYRALAGRLISARVAA